MGTNISLLSLLLALFFDTVQPEDWTHHTVLDGDGKYHLYWTPPGDKKSDSEIFFKVEVETKGYVGFGLSPNGGMAGSDMITAWIKNGKVYFQDRYGVGNRMPIYDSQQDWKVIEGYENDTSTVFKFSRKLDTCDENDMKIDESTMRVIYAYSKDDPESDDPDYHFGNRGSKSIMLLQSKIKRNEDLDFSSLLQWTVTSPSVDISSYKSLYWCKIFKSPSISKKHHIVYVKPLIQEGHEQFLHHMLLYECVGGGHEEYEMLLDYKGHVCHHPNMPNAMKKCEGVSIAWAVGGEDVKLPEHVGLPLEANPDTYFMLEIHYDNPQLEKGIVDNSGLTLYHTPSLRKYDAGCLMIGSTISPRVFIPPEQKNYIVVGHSNPDCLGPEIPKNGIKVLGVLLHSHLLGRKIKARHFRGNQELTPLAEEKNYDFNYQEYRYFTEEVDFLPNDQLSVECTYDSSGRNNVTLGGKSTRDEMCLAFVLYYPRINRYASLSVPAFGNINEVLNINSNDIRVLYYDLLRYDWAKADISKIENAMRNLNHTTHCYFGNGKKDGVRSEISYPRNLKPVAKEPTCIGTEKTEGTLKNENSRDEDRSKQAHNSASLWTSKNFFLVLCLISLVRNLTK